MTLKVSDKTSEPKPSQGKGQFCATCNSTPCKLINKPAENENNKQVAKRESNTITIVVDRNELCRTICSENVSTNEEKNRSSDNVDKGSDYCNYCKAPICQIKTKSSGDELENPNKNNKGTEQPNPSESHKKEKQRSNDNVDKGSEYCDLCNSSKCQVKVELTGDELGKRNEGTVGQVQSKLESNTKQRDDMDKGSEYCDLCKAPKCQLKVKLSEDELGTPNEIKMEKEQPKSETNLKRLANDDVDEDSAFCIWCNAPECELNTKSSESTGNSDAVTNWRQKPKLAENVSESLQKGKQRSNEVTKRNKSSTSVSKNCADITKSLGYCSACKLPKCKYESSSTPPISTSTSPQMIENVKSPSTISSDKVLITVDRSEICDLICPSSSTSLQKTSSKENMMGTSSKKNAKAIEMGDDYCKFCGSQKCKLLTATATKSDTLNKNKPQERMGLRSNKKKLQSQTKVNSNYEVDNSVN